MKRLLALALSVLTSALTTFGESSPADIQKVVVGNTAFATDLYAKLKNQPGNLFFSPYSISTALAMTYAGARGNTATQMANVLHFSVPQERLHPSFAALEAELNAVQKKGKVQLSVANSLWPQKGYPFRPEYLGLVKQYYGSNISPLDYEHATEAARKTINDWVERKTNRKITDLIKPGVLDSMTRLVLANAIYFKGNWASQFDSKETEEERFLVAADKSVKCKLMHRTRTYAYAETPELQVLELSYARGDLSTVVLLPRRIDGFGTLEAQLAPAKLAEWTQALREYEVMVSLPKFKLTREFSLKETLIAMGMADAFSGNADFSGMERSRGFFVSTMVHKAFVDVNEQGTEAAAATAVVRPLGMAPEPVVFRADHPFIFLIQDKQNGSILFMGRVTDPTK